MKKKRFAAFMRRHRVLTRALAMMLTVIISFYVIPTVIYAEIGDAIAASENGDAIIADVTESRKDQAVYEDESLREVNAKHFRLSDGSYVAAQYAYPVHYVSESGELEDIDNTLAEASGGVYATPEARIKFVKKTTGSSSIFTLKDGSTKLTMSLIGAKKGVNGEITNYEDSESDTELQKMMNLEKISSKIIYEEILDGVDLEYIVHSLNVKENIIVKKKQSSYSYSFEIKLNGLTAQLAENGDINIRNESDGEIKYVIPAPIIYDASGEYASEGTSAFSLDGGENGKYELTVSVSSEWMNSEDRVFPVTVDPTLGQVPKEPNFMDAYVNMLTPNTNYFASSYLAVSENETIYLKFALPISDTRSLYVSNATLSLYTFQYTSGIQIGVSIINSNWGSDITYAHCPAYESAYQDIVTPVNVGYVDWDITYATKKWYERPANNYGVALRIFPSSTSGRALFNSLQTSINKPMVSITYRTMTGVKEYLTYSSHSMGIAGSGNVNLATGELNFEIPTLATTDSLMPYSPTLVYNSVMSGLDYNSQTSNSVHASSPAPLGMILSTSESIIPRTVLLANRESVRKQIYTDSSGAEIYFDIDVETTNKAVDEDGLGINMFVNRNSEDVVSEIILINKNKEKRYFSPSNLSSRFYLTKIEDKNGNAIVFDTDSQYRATAISLDPAGSAGPIQMLTLHYNSDGRLVRVYNPTSKESAVLRYSATCDGAIVATGGKYLRNIDYARGTDSVTDANWTSFEASASANTNITVNASAYYEFNSTGSLIAIADGLSGKKISYTLNSVKKIMSVSEQATTTSTLGQSVRYSYGNGYTDVRTSGTDDEINTSDDAVTRYVFDNYGRTVSMYSYSYDGGEIYGAVTGKYADDEQVKNSLKERTILGGTSTNLLYNSGFELYDEATASFDTWTSNAGVTAVSADSEIGEGNYGVKISPTVGTTSYVQKALNLKPGTYTLSFPYASCEFEGAIATVEIKSVADGTTLSTAMIKTNAYTGVLRSRFSMSFSLAETSNNIRISIKVINESATAPYLYVDKVMLEKSSYSSEYSLIHNGGFESSDQVTSTRRWEASNTDLGINIEYVSAPFYRTLCMLPGYNQNYVKQRVFEVSDSEILSIANNNNGEDYILSGYAIAPNALKSGRSPFRMVLEIAYYQGQGVDDHIARHYVDFVPGVVGWQFASGTFSTIPDDPISGVNYGTIRYIDVICEYSYQPNGYALFDNVSLTVGSGADRNIEKFSYNSYGYLAIHQNGSNREYYVYDGYGNVITYANNRGQMKRYVYGYGEYSYLVMTVYDETFVYSDGSTDFKYDEDNPYSLMSDIIIKSRTTYTYHGPHGLVRSETVEEMACNEYGVYEVSGLPLITKYEYELEGSKIFGALTEVSDDRYKVKRYFYNDATGDILAEIDVNCGTGTVYTYDAMRRLIAIHPATYSAASNEYSASGSERVLYTYDMRDRISTIETRSTVYTISYDLFGNQESVSIGDSDPMATYTYNDHNGKLNKITYSNGFIVEYEYNEVELLSKVWYTYDTGRRSLAYEYRYYADGSLYQHINCAKHLITTYLYDADGNPTHCFVSDYTAEYANVYSIEYGYDDMGRVSGVVYNVYNATDYNSTDCVWGEILHTMFSSTYSYGADGVLADQYYDVVLYDGTTDISRSITYLYDSFGRIMGTYNDTLDPESSGFVSHTEYVYDSYITNEDEDATSFDVAQYFSTVNGSTTEYSYHYGFESKKYIESMYKDSDHIWYSYDDLGQLKIEHNEELGKRFEYTYDNAGNITSKYIKTIGEQGGTRVQYYYTNSAWGDQLTKYDGVTITYDELGNPLSYYNGRNYVFSWDGRFLKDWSDNEWGYDMYYVSYSDDGKITEASSASHITYSYYYDGDLLTEIESEFTRWHFFYDANGSPIGYSLLDNTDGYTWSYYWYEKNMQGDIIAVYDNEGTKLISYAYDAWGNFTITRHTAYWTEAEENPFTYRGYYYHHALGMYYLGTRWYDPVIGRFISPDKYVSTGQGILGCNMYAYCGNNPVNFVDPSGEAPWLIIGIIALFGVAGAIIGASLDTRIIDNVKNVNTASAKPIEVKNNIGDDLPGSENIVDNPPCDNSDGVTLQDDELTTKDRVANGLIGAAGGVAAGGAVVMLAGAGVGLYALAIAKTAVTFGGMTALQIISVGALSYNVLPILVAPLIGLEMDAVSFK